MIKIIDSMNFLSNLDRIVNIATTYKVITPPPGIEKIKRKTSRGIQRSTQ